MSDTLTDTERVRILALLDEMDGHASDVWDNPPGSYSHGYCVAACTFARRLRESLDRLPVEGVTL